MDKIRNEWGDLILSEVIHMPCDHPVVGRTFCDRPAIVICAHGPGMMAVALCAEHYHPQQWHWTQGQRGR